MNKGLVVLLYFIFEDVLRVRFSCRNIYLALCNIQNTGSPARLLSGLPGETQICNIANIN